MSSREGLRRVKWVVRIEKKAIYNFVFENLLLQVACTGCLWCETIVYDVYEYVFCQSDGDVKWNDDNNNHDNNNNIFVSFTIASYAMSRYSQALFIACAYYFLFCRPICVCACVVVLFSRVALISGELSKRDADQPIDTNIIIIITLLVCFFFSRTHTLPITMHMCALRGHTGCVGH